MVHRFHNPSTSSEAGDSSFGGLGGAGVSSTSSFLDRVQMLDEEDTTSSEDDIDIESWSTIITDYSQTEIVQYYLFRFT